MHRNALEPCIIARAELERTVVVPLMEDHFEWCPPHARRFIGSQHAVRILRDKRAFAQYVCEQKLSEFTPRVFPSAQEATFPCVVKRADLNASRAVQLAHSHAELQELLERDEFCSGPMLIQEFIPGSSEFVVHCIARNGRIEWHRAYRYETGNYAIKRPGLPAEDFQVSSEQLLILERFLTPLHFSGPCCIDCKTTPQGTLSVFEINPRFGGSLMTPSRRDDLAELLALIVKHAA